MNAENIVSFLIDIAFTFFLVFLNGFFVAAEFALVKVRVSQLEVRAKEGVKAAKLATHLVEHLDAYLSACQLGITIASLGLGWIGESVVAELLASVLLFIGLPISQTLIHQISFPLAFAVITFLHITLGELLPKSLAIRFPETLSIGVAYPMRFFYILLFPFIVTLNGFSNWLLKLVGLEVQVEHEIHSPEELKYVVEKSLQQTAPDPFLPVLLQNIFRFTQTKVRQIMIPRTEIVAVDITTPIQDIVEIITEEGYSRLPVYRGTIDQIVGILYAKDLLTLLQHPQLIILEDILRPPLFVPETFPIAQLLPQMQQQKIHMAIVQDEFGGTAGLVTLEDILEELVGEIRDEYDEEEPLVEKLPSGSYIAAGKISISDLNRILPHPLPESEHYNTLAGLLTYHCERMPKMNETITIDGYQFTIIQGSERKLDRIQIDPLTTFDDSSEVQSVEQ